MSRSSRGGLRARRARCASSACRWSCRSKIRCRGGPAASSASMALRSADDSASSSGASRRRSVFSRIGPAWSGPHSRTAPRAAEEVRTSPTRMRRTSMRPAGCASAPLRAGCTPARAECRGAQPRTRKPTRPPFERKPEDSSVLGGSPQFLEARVSAAARPVHPVVHRVLLVVVLVVLLRRPEGTSASSMGVTMGCANVLVRSTSAFEASASFRCAASCTKMPSAVLLAHVAELAVADGRVDVVPEHARAAFW